MDEYYGASPTPEYYLHVAYTAEYPDTLPVFSIVRAVGLSDSETAELLRLVNESAAAQVGMALVFGVHAAAVEALREHVAARDAAAEAAREARLAAAEAEERARLAGTKVTPASFAAWRAAFLVDAAAAEKRAAVERLGGPNSAAAKAAAKAEANKGRLTGRALFEKDKNLALSDVALMADGDVGVDTREFEGLEEEPEDEDDEEVNDVLANFNEDDD
ncbi:hypothetical protein BDR26DRAFT_797227 [Obelidium mucronatum]|nr:hypothetical protein BDR26DRAFT_797227 [Obelidium mucronatum]